MDLALQGACLGQKGASKSPFPLLGTHWLQAVWGESGPGMNIMVVLPPGGLPMLDFTPGYERFNLCPLGASGILGILSCWTEAVPVSS